MVEVDSSLWPIVFMMLDGLITVEAFQEYIDELEELLGRSEQQHECFGLIYLSTQTDADYETEQRSQEANALSSSWLKTTKARISAHCVGIAMVTQAEEMMKKMKPVIRQSLEQGMGAPGDIFLTKSEAVDWITEQLSQNQERMTSNHKRQMTNNQSPSQTKVNS